MTNVADTYYLLGSALGAHPYPMMVRDFHRVIGDEARAQILEAEGRLPGRVIACVGGGSNAIGAFLCVHRGCKREADRRGSGRTQRSWASMRRDFPAARRAFSMVVQLPSAGRGRAGLADALGLGRSRLRSVGPEHAWLHDQGRAEYCSATDDDAIEAAKTLARTEGIIPALESAHAFMKRSGALRTRRTRFSS